MERATLRALVVDDEPEVRGLITDLLRHVVGVGTVDAVAGGAAALALFAPRRYDLVVTDLMMPGMSGWEVADAIRERDPEVRLLMLTGSARAEDVRRASVCGFPVLDKPISIQDFRAAVDAVLGLG
ncbi:MAG TPA: response regulator [Vicinamibacteria bacterium]|nr:response regulator [Vicinamibacteria bacterium]